MKKNLKYRVYGGRDQVSNGFVHKILVCSLYSGNVKYFLRIFLPKNCKLTPKGPKFFLSHEFVTRSD